MSVTIGIDFGTTNSLVSVVLDGKVRCYLDNNLPHPSVVCYSASDVICGREAKDLIDSMATAESDGIVRSPKRWLGKGAQYVLGRQLEPARVVADLMRHLRQHAVSLDGKVCSFDRAVVSIPVAMDGRKRRELRDALMQVGINVVQFVHEPLAALYAHFRDREDGVNRYVDHAGELALVFDWGGGTLDLTLCQLDGDHMSQIDNLGDNEVGGDYIDEAIRRQVLAQHLASHGLDRSVDVNPGAPAKLLEQCERAKMRLSERETALIYVPDYFAVKGDAGDIEYSLQRSELEDIAQEYVSRGLSTIERLLGRLDLDQRRIAMCLATGGMINMPSIRSSLLQLFGADRLHVSPRGDRIISEGCAWIAHDNAGLTLSKPIEVVEARQSWLPVFKEGDRLPIEGEVMPENLVMYCVDPRDGKAKFQLVRPRHLGKNAASDARDSYDILTVRVDPEAKPFRERIDLKFAIDADLVVNVSAKSALREDTASTEIFELEFALSSGALVDPASSGGGRRRKKPKTVRESLGRPGDGEVCLRANVTRRSQGDHLVPGEYLYQINPKRFNKMHPDPLPQLSHDEKLVYTPCSVCGDYFRFGQCGCTRKRMGALGKSAAVEVKTQ